MKKRIGEFLIQKGILTEAQVEEALNYSVQTGLRFGEAAEQLGFLDQATLEKTFGQSYKTDFFYIDVEVFPTDSKDLFTIDEMIEHGVVALGISAGQTLFKKNKRTLNLGFLNPQNADRVAKVEALIRSKGIPFDAFKSYLVLVDQFVEVLTTIYQVKEETISKREPQKIEESLQLYLRVKSA